MTLNLIIEKIGFSVCHQLPSRSLYFGKIFLPVCSRCSGIYLGFFISAIILFATFRKKESELPPLYIFVILILFILSTVIDGFLSYFGPFGTNNLSRFITGFLCGSSVMAIIYPVFSYQFFKRAEDKKIFNRPKEFIIYLSLLSGFIALTLARIGLLGYFFYYLTGFSIIFTFYFINLVLILLLPPFSKKANRLLSKYLTAPSAISLVLASLEIFLSFKFHQLMSRLVSNLI